MNDAAQWWYERGGQQVGPVTLEALQQLAAAGQLAPTSLVWTAGMPGWARADTIPSLAWPSAPPPMPPAARQAAPAPPALAPPGFGAAPQAAPTSAAAAVAEPEEIAILPLILISIVTLGIYGLIKFFQTARALERLAGRETKFSLWFWIFVGLSFAGGFLGALTGGFTFPLGIASLVFMFLALAEALRARNEGVQRWGLQVTLTSDNRHYVYLALGILLSPVLVGFVFLILQAMRWFEDWNQLRAAALRRGQPAPTSPAARPS